MTWCLPLLIQLHYSISLLNRINSLHHQNRKENKLKIIRLKPTNKFLQNKIKIPISWKQILLLPKKLHKVNPAMTFSQNLHLKIYLAINPIRIWFFKTNQMRVKVSLAILNKNQIFLIKKLMKIHYLKISKLFFLINQTKATFSRIYNLTKEIFLVYQIINQTNL